MLRLIALVAAVLMAGALPVHATVPFVGDWAGALKVGGASLRLVFHIRPTAESLGGSMDSLDQGAMGIPLREVTLHEGHVKIVPERINAVFEGELDGDGKVLSGHWRQGGQDLPLTLAPQAAGAQAAPLNRPQTPKPPFPYRDEAVTFDDAPAQVRLAGSLTLPEGPGPFPAVVLIAGSGPHTRNEPILGHQIFWVLADRLTRDGVAVLRYDKRGVGASTGSYAAATTEDFANDARAAIDYLRSRSDIDPRRVGLIGHSEGGLIAPMVAARDPRVAFLVLMAAPGVNGAAILEAQGRLVARAMGESEARIDAEARLRSRAIAIVRTEKDPATAAARLRAEFEPEARAQGLDGQAIDAQIRAINSEWFRFFFDYDPAPTLAKVRCPVLALSGSKDLQVPPDLNLPVIRRALAGARDAEVEELPNLNHLFQTARTGGISEYGEIEETLAPAALDTISGWIVKHVGRPAS